MTEKGKLIEIPFQIDLFTTHRIGEISESQKAEMIAVKCAFMCDGLFWMLGKFSDMAWNSDMEVGDDISPDELFFSISYVSELGRGLASACYKAIDDIHHSEDEVGA